MNPTLLPVYKQKQKIINALKEHQVVVVESPTGSGKTTQIPQILYHEWQLGRGIIGVTQPRRIAAVSVTEFIAEQLHKQIPDTIGYKMRFEDKTDGRTKIKIMTDGTLLQEIKTDYDLSQYSVIMVDEAHERNLNIDFILGLLKGILERRSDFRVIVSSATINPESFSVYFDDCPIVKIDSIVYPVEIYYDPPQPENDYDALLAKIRDKVIDVLTHTKEGDILIFLSGEKAIKDCMRSLSLLPEQETFEILPLYARLSSQEQERVFLSYDGKRKIIVATNIAETSVTIDGVTAVIDSGLAKMNYYNPKTFTSSLVETVISKASAQQRKGRAGRTQAGVCYRLYSKKEYEQRHLYTTEEIFRTDLSEVVLRMAEIGIKDFEDFEFISPPGREGIISAMETLYLLDALNKERELTEIGKMMARFPLLPRHSRIIVESIYHYPTVLEEVLIATAFLTVNSPFVLPPDEEIEARKAHHSFKNPMGDFVSYLKLYRAYVKNQNKVKFSEEYYLDKKVMDEICNVIQQLKEIVAEMNIPLQSGGSIADYLTSISRGLIQFVCVRNKQEMYRSLTAGSIQIHPGSVMFKAGPEYIVAGEIVKTSRMYARSVSPLKPEWLKRISPNLLNELKGRGKGGQPRHAERDYTNQIKIGKFTFSIITQKGKKVVILPWARLQELLQDINIPYLADYRHLRGKIIFEQYEILNGMRLNTILKVAGWLKPEAGIILKWPRNKNFNFQTESSELCRYIDHLLYLCKRKKKQKRLGFLTLNTDGAGLYWYSCESDFHKALSESLAGLENIIDELAGLIENENIPRIKQMYRKLSQMVEQ
jgi:ATP-dependent helicase HrpA